MKFLHFKNILLKSILIVLLQATGFIEVFAQTDSLTVVNARWETRKVAPGVWLKQAWFNQSLFHSNQNISILEVVLKGRNRIDVAAEPQQLITTSTFGAKHKALAALNGTFFDMKNGGSVDYIRMDGQVLYESRKDENGKPLFHQNAALVTSGHKLTIESRDGTDNWESNLSAEDVMVSGPLLLKNKIRTRIDSIKFCTARHPRTALAVSGKHVLLITVDGRNDKAFGMSLFELASFMKWIGANDGINLDGGGSTTLWVRGFPDGGVINHPSDNHEMVKSKDYIAGMDLDNLAADLKKWDHSGERKVANVLLLNKHK